jgi:hypothetical protein
MRKMRILVIVLLIILLALPLFAKRGRSRTKWSPLTLSLYGGMEDLLEESRYFIVGGDAILPIVTPFLFRVTLLRVNMLEGNTTFSLATGFGGDVMYYWQVPMSFIPYAFGGLNFYKSSEPDKSNLTVHLGAGGQMRGSYGIFVEGGLDFVSISTGGESDSSTPIFVHGGVRFPLFK